MINRLKGALSQRSELTKSVMVVASGTAMAQAIPILGTFLLVRIYDPAEFGIYTLIVSLVAFGVATGAAKYDVAIVLPKSDKTANHLSNLSFFIGLGFSLLVLLGTIVFREPMARGLGLKPEDGFWLYWLPLFVFLGISYQILMNNATRYKSFKLLSASRVGRSSTLISTQIGLGYSHFFGGLIAGPALGNLFGIFYLRRGLREKFSLAKASELKTAAKLYDKFPKYSLLAGSINSFSNQVPIVLMLKFFSETSAGHFGLTQRMLSLPVALMANAILDVFKQKASEQYNQTGDCREVYLWTLKRLLLLSVPIFGLLAIFAPNVFSIFFGEEWYESGVYARILCILFMARFVASPLSYVMFISGKQKYDLAWQVMLATFTVASFYIGFQQDNPRMALLLFSSSYGFMYIINLFMSYRFSKGVTLIGK